MSNISTTNHLIEKCLGCNSDDVHPRLIKRKRKKKSPMVRTIKKSIGYSDYEDKVLIKKELNPAKAYNLFLTSNANSIKNPTLSLPKLESAEDRGLTIRQFISLLKEDVRYYNVPLEISQLIFVKYPLVKEKIDPIRHLILKGYEVLDEIEESAANDQNKRSLVDWIPICNTALNEGYHVASRKYYSITPEGKKKYLSPKYIKKKIPQIEEFKSRYYKYVPFYDSFAYNMLTIAQNDLKIFNELKKIELRRMREYIPGILQTFKSILMEVQGVTKGTFSNQNVNNDTNYYEYVEFRHINKIIYEEQKLKIKEGKRKANPDGWKTCCIIKAEDLPLETLEHLRKQQPKCRPSNK